MRIPTAEERRRDGKYYTPNQATQILCSWAIRQPHDVLLEPSFGACGFLEASWERLRDLQCPDPGRQLFGCDIDQDAFGDHLMPLFDFHDELLNQFHAEDFLSITPDQFTQPFSAVIGNPPYISHHRMSAAQKATIERVFADSPHKPHRRADLWVYFVLHSLQFLRDGGRMAWILPGSFLQTDYSALVREVIGEKFERSLAIQLGEKLFVSEGAQENTIVVLADGFRRGSAPLSVQYAANLAELESLMDRWNAGEEIGFEIGENAKTALLHDDVRVQLEHLGETYRTPKLGDLCIIRIGIVTGANWFFVLNRSTACKNFLPEERLRPLVSKFSLVKGLTLLQDDLLQAAADDFPCLLLDTRDWQDSDGDPIGIYLNSLDAEVRANTKTFHKRSVWHQPDDGLLPDAFLSYMHEHGPRLALNDAGTTCTNTIHRANFRAAPTLHERQAIVLALQSTYAQLHSEIEGRSYGSGVLKHEPKGVKAIRLLMPQVVDAEATQRAFCAIDLCLRAGDTAQAQNIADEWAFADVRAQEGEEAFQRIRHTLREALQNLRDRRHHA